MTDFEMDSDAEEQINLLCDKMFETKLGPMMETEAKRNCPVDLDNLRQSITASVDRDEHTLNIEAGGDQKRTSPDRRNYALYVELGHRVFVYGHETGEVRQPQPFLRPALYRRYAGF